MYLLYLTPWNDTTIFLYIIFEESEALVLLNSAYFFVAQGKREKVYREGREQIELGNTFFKKSLNLSLRKPVFEELMKF